MVEYTSELDSVFGSLADPTRRDILRRVTCSELTVSEIANPYDMSLSAVSKHLKVLEEAGLITKRKKGKKHLVRAAVRSMEEAERFLQEHRRLKDEFLIEVDVLVA
ncbi:MAG TPA: metalloregulator ArsR/SmtB family transcription factor [Candidatus Saccharimonadales bacterium]|nr:metalloregulator ArsR/SmtB family transcription factor [Candidatus Saccharimonadales bacterium]